MLECLPLGIPYLYTYNNQDYSHYPHCFYFENQRSLGELLASSNWKAIRHSILPLCQSFVKMHHMSYADVLGEYEKIFL
jgi:hypothetical protein